LTLLKGYRERLHGHNYRVDLKIWGDRGHDGYVVDFGKMKAVIRQLCKEINEHVIIPAKSDVLLIEEEGDNITIKTEDNSFFSFPQQDCKLLPIIHSSAEELAQYIVSAQSLSCFSHLYHVYLQLLKTIDQFSEDYLINNRGVTAMEVSVAEAPNQLATCKVDLGASPLQLPNEKVEPKPCPCQH